MLAFVDFYFNYYTWLDALLAADQEYMSLPAEHFVTKINLAAVSLTGKAG